jgi:hypothetical protein
MPTTRANFLKGILAGIAAAPVAAQTKTYAPAVEGSAHWKEKRWKSNGINFREFTLPRTLGPYFEEDRKDRPQFRKVFVAMFDRRVEDRPLNKLVEQTIEAAARTEERFKRHNMPIVDEDGKEIDYGSTYHKQYGNVTIVKVDGFPHLMGITATEHPLLPVSDFYRDVAARNDRVKHGMSRMKADYSKEVVLTDREKGARGQDNESGFRRAGSRLKTL